MIRKQDILDRAAEWQLRPDVVEKDYALGWLLAAMPAHPDTAERWIFKGGTCIKKCFLETYRFSEDLDFSLLQDAPYTENEIKQALQVLASTAAELSGIEFPTDWVDVRDQRNKQGLQTFQGRISYRGPLAWNRPELPRILIDITRHEPVLDPPMVRPVFHPYPDELPGNTAVLTYSFDELMAEKTRALFERCRPRDLYDVIFLLENRPDAIDFEQTRDIFHRKCEFKRFAPPSAAALIQVVQEETELKSEWENMLAHQLPVLPILDDLLGRLPGLLEWIDEPTAMLPMELLTAAPGRAGEAIVAPSGIQYWGVAPLEKVRFAGANRLLVEFDYDFKHRIVEPYSLRRAQSTGNLLLYAWERHSNQIEAFNIDKIQNLRSTNESFAPRYRVELTEGALNVAPIIAHSSVPTSYRRNFGSKYVYKCSHCGRQFRHSTRDSHLRPHKTKDGWDCKGRTAHYVDTIW